MSYPERNNPYSFDAFLEWRNQVDYYADDPFIQAVVKTYTGEEWRRLDEAAREISPKISFRWRDMADAVSRPEKRPYVTHFDGHNPTASTGLKGPWKPGLWKRRYFPKGFFPAGPPRGRSS
jgi:hypothetical protein